MRWMALVLSLVHTLACTEPAVAAGRLLAPRIFARGADDSTVAAFEQLLLQEMRHAAGDDALVVVTAPGAAPAPCADPACVAQAARRAGTEGGFLCTLVRLGDAHVVELSRIDPQGNTVWSQRRTAARAEDLAEVAARLAAGADARHVRAGAGADRTREGASAADPAAEGEGPKRALVTQGPRLGTVLPLGGSYAGAARLTSFAWVWRHQTPNFAVEAVPALGLAWGGSFADDGGTARDWSVLDLFVSWAPLPVDVAPVVGAGIGLHGLRLQRDTALGRVSENTLGVALAAGGGLVLFRSYDFQVALDARYHVLLDRFEDTGGKGAHGFTLTFGLQRR